MLDLIDLNHKGVQMTNKIKVALNLNDSYLDLKYYKIEIEYWDKDKELIQNKSCFVIGDILNFIFNKFDNFNQNLEVEFKIKNDPVTLQLLQYSCKQIDSIGVVKVTGRLQACRTLTSSEKNAKALRDYLKIYNCTFN